MENGSKCSDGAVTAEGPEKPLGASHSELTRAVLLQLQAYFQVTGGAFVIKRAVIENLKLRKHSNIANKKSGEANSKHSISSEEMEFRNIFGGVYRREYLNEFYKRFSSDHKTVTLQQSSLYKLTKTCVHVKELKLILALLYFKDR